MQRWLLQVQKKYLKTEEIMKRKQWCTVKLVIKWLDWTSLPFITNFKEISSSQLPAGIIELLIPTCLGSVTKIPVF